LASASGKALVEEVAVVLIAGHGQDRRVFDTPPALYRLPGRGECARIFDEDSHLDALTIGRELPALGHVDLRGVRRAGMP
jgi:hypothetical protein